MHDPNAATVEQPRPVSTVHDPNAATVEVPRPGSAVHDPNAATVELQQGGAVAPHEAPTAEVAVPHQET
ncbi:hypothetical protein, partial [Nocardia cerradoensis]|uniref:hypothetical protein n=1 Tax=Nocardia cerradoensis TaxID=85688 RepID=UPI001CB8F459